MLELDTRLLYLDLRLRSGSWRARKAGSHSIPLHKAFSGSDLSRLRPPVVASATFAEDHQLSADLVALAPPGRVCHAAVSSRPPVKSVEHLHSTGIRSMRSSSDGCRSGRYFMRRPWK
jgi:hypothetical protein